jgi:hypothetical protein
MVIRLGMRVFFYATIVLIPDGSASILDDDIFVLLFRTFSLWNIVR